MRRILIGLVVLTLIGAGTWSLFRSTPYRVSVVLPTAPNVIKGAIVQVNGFQAGEVSDIRATDNHAVLDVALDSAYAPLHDGAKVNVQWKAVLGERQLAITDGSKGNATLPSGGMISGQMPEPVEIDTVLAALDPSTRAHLASLIQRLNSTTNGHEQDLNATIKSAGPAVKALGEVLRNLGNDGPAIKQLVTRMDGMVTALANRDKDISAIVEELGKATNATARQRQQLSTALRQLPGTLQSANTTLGDLPPAVRNTLPVLHDLQPVTQKLPALAANLSPVLQELRPTIATLRPTLGAAASLLQNTPGLLDSAHGVLPGLNSTVTELTPALGFLRPYTPELIGWMSNWGSATANYDVNGHYMRSSINGGGSSADVNPGAPIPGVRNDPYPLPGSLENQPWTDAFGSGER